LATRFNGLVSQPPPRALFTHRLKLVASKLKAQLCNALKLHKDWVGKAEEKLVAKVNEQKSE
jgi:hypothetical protein